MKNHNKINGLKTIVGTPPALSGFAFKNPRALGVSRVAGLRLAPARGRMAPLALKKNHQMKTMNDNAKKTYPWELQAGFPVGGFAQHELGPLVEVSYQQALTGHAWTVMGEHWTENQPAFKELVRLQPEGCEALAGLLAKHFMKQMPDAGITPKEFWDDFCIFNLRACHDYEEDEWFKAYLRFRADLPQLLPFLRRVVKAADAKETPGLGDRMVFCIFWDLFILPMRFWSDDAAAGLLCESGQTFNLDKVRNTRRELGLKQTRPVIVKRFKSLPPAAPGAPVQIQVEIDDSAAKHAGVSAMLQALLVFLKAPQFQSRKTT
jgi:hypothetical protein